MCELKPVFLIVLALFGNSRVIFLCFLTSFSAGSTLAFINDNFTECLLPSKGTLKWWSSNNGNTCYYFNPWTSMNYYDGQKYCRDQGATLVSVHSDNVNQFLVSLTEKENIYYTSRGVWLGLRRDPETGQKQQWSDGSSLDYVNWDSNEDEPTEHCTYMAINTKSASKGRWFHHNCGDLNSVVCKKSAKGGVSLPRPTLPPVGECENGWFKFNDKCYLINFKLQTFDEAASECRTYWNSDLVSIHTNEQQNFLTTLLGTTNQTTYWLGAYKAAGSRYLWKSNEKFNYDNWGPDSPSGNLVSGSRCVRLALENVHDAGFWEDVPCDRKISSVCQKFTSHKNALSTSKFPNVCPNVPSYFQYRNACFKIFTSLTSWQDAGQVCKQEGADLVSISDSLEHSLVTRLAKETNVRDIWIGLSGIKDKYELFNWTDHAPIYFTNWGETVIPKTNVTQCVYQNTSGSWIATSECGALKAFSCKLYLNGRPQMKHRKKFCPALNYSLESAQKHWVDLDPELEFCYLFEHNTDSYPTARYNCHLNGGDLVSIHNEHEAKLLSSLAVKTAGKRSKLNVWIGLHRRTSGGFGWVDETAANFFSWTEEEPSNQTSQKCVSTDQSFMNWKTSSCFYSHSKYICAVKKVNGLFGFEPIVHKVDTAKVLAALALIIFLSGVLLISFYGSKCVTIQRDGTRRHIAFKGVAFARQRLVCENSF